MTTPTREPQGPPKDVDASELWLTLTAIPVPHVVEDFPVKDPVMGTSFAKVAIVPLAPEEMFACRKLAYDYTSKLFDGEKPESGKESEAFRQVMGDEATIQILHRALRDANDSTLARKAIPSPLLMRRAPFTSDLLAVLLKMYLTACMKCGPIISTMSKIEMDAWLDALEEGAAAVPFEWFSLGMQSDLLMHSVARCKALRTASGSRGGPQGASSTGSGQPTMISDEPAQTPPSDSPPVLVADDLVIGKP